MKIIIFIFVIAFFSWTWLLVYQNNYLKNQLKSKSLVTTQPPSSPTPTITNLKTYQSREFGFELDYAYEWELATENEGGLLNGEALQLKWDTKSELEFSLEADPRSLDDILSQLAFDYQDFISEKRFYIVEPTNSEGMINSQPDWIFLTGDLDRPTLVFKISYPANDISLSIFYQREIRKILANLRFLPLSLKSRRTYKNTEKGYSVQYPADKFVRLNCPGEEFLLVDRSAWSVGLWGYEVEHAPTCGRDSRYNVEISTHETEVEEPKEDEGYRLIREQTFIAGFPATKYTFVPISVPQGDSSQGSTIVFLKRDNKTYELFFSSGVAEVSNQILSTLRFDSGQ